MDWEQQGLFTSGRVNDWSCCPSPARARADGHDVRVLGVRVSEEYLQARALVLYSEARVGDGEQLGLALLEARDGEVSQVGTGLLPATSPPEVERAWRLEEVRAVPRADGVDLHVRGTFDGAPGSRRVRALLGERTYVFLPEGVDWLELQPDAAGLAAAPAAPGPAPDEDALVVLHAERAGPLSGWRAAPR
ncbi:hypothetical protein [Kineococcus gypseus]|uniref:hypothetical protein n=1 Tax=Kineococcus gypseus TaxID=1637102 RepID=UPI003D7D2601